ncbi:MAG: hypothetical protein V1748_07425 [Actinomycetota bacterium]
MKKTPARGRGKAIPRFSKGKTTVLLATTLLVVSLVLMGAPGVSVAQTVVATVPVGTSPEGVGVNPTTYKISVTNAFTKNVSVLDGASDTVTATVGVGTSPFGVGVNPTTNKIYVANKLTNNVSVINGVTDTVTATVVVGASPEGVGVNPTTNKIYVTIPGSNNVSVIDGVTDTVTATVGVGNQPRGVGVNPTTNKIYVANELTGNVSVIDGVTDIVTATVGVGAWPADVGVNPATNYIYVSINGSNNVSVIDGATDTVTATVGVGTSPFGVGANLTTNRIYVVNKASNDVSVIDGATDIVTTTVGVGTSPNGVGANPATNKIYVANNGSNDVSVINGVADTVTTTVGVGTSPEGVGVNPTTNKIYVANGGSNNVSVIDGATDTVTTMVWVGTNPEGVGVNPTTNKIYVANNGSNDVSVIDGATNTVTSTVGVGTNPEGVGVNPTTNKIYVANNGSNDVSVIDGATDTVTTTVGVGTNPFGVGVNPATNKIYVANEGSDYVSVIDGATDTVTITVVVRTAPHGVGVNPTTNKVYVANNGSNDVSVIYDPNSLPTTTGMNPTSKTAGDPGFTLTVDGTNFIPVSVVRWEGADRATTYVSDLQLTATIPASDITTAGTFDVTVFNPAPGGGESNAQMFTVNNPLPTTTGMDPTSKTAGDPGFTLTVDGTNFVAASTVRWDGADRATAYVSDTQLTATIPASDIATAGTFDVTVFNPAPGGGESNAQTFTIEHPAPTVTSITPNSADNDGTVSITDLKGTNFRNGATVKLIGPSGSGKSGAGIINATNVNVVSSTKITCKFNFKGTGAGAYTVKVTNTDGKSGSKPGAFKVNESPAPPATTPTWFLAEGTTAWGYECYITIENPNSEAVSATVTYMTDAGAVPGGDINLPANSQATVNPASILGEKDFSTKVECKEGKTIAVDRTMTWTGEGAPSPDGHCSIGVTGADTTWYLAEGSSAWGFQCWLLIQNPNAQEATAQVTYMIEGADPVTVQKKIPAQSRKTYNMADDIGAKDASIKVVSDIPVIPERAMYKNNSRSGHDSIGTTAAAPSYYLAEGTTDYGFTTYVLVQNPNAGDAEVTVTYMTSSGPVPQGSFTMPGNSRKTIRVNDVLPASDFSTQVTGSQLIIAERAMYWGEDTVLGEAAHDSIGLAAPHTTFYLPDGETSNGRETYTLVQNPNNTAVTVEVSYLTPDGTGNVVFTETVTANSRKTFNMADKGITGRAAVMVTCKTAGAKIMVERAMYWNSRGAGTDTIGGFSD